MKLSEHPDFEQAILRAADYYCYPEGMVFAKSDVIFPTPELSRAVKPEYEEQCKLLCYGSYPSWVEVLARFNELRDVL